jgi:hypothetical protein
MTTDEKRTYVLPLEVAEMKWLEVGRFGSGFRE